MAISGAEHNPSIRERKKLGFLRDILFGNHWLVREMIDNCRDFVTAGHLPELVEKMNALQGDQSVELEAVQDAVDRYDATIARGENLMNDEQLRRIACAAHNIAATASGSANSSRSTTPRHCR